MEDEQLYPAGDFSLEVSSPGVDTPLQMHRQYIKNIGRKVEITFTDGAIKTGRLVEVTGSDIIIEEAPVKGKKGDAQQIVIPFLNIKTTTVQIQF